MRAAARSPAAVLPCAPWVCDWIALRTGVDPIADLRERWTRRSVAQRIRHAGGFEAMVRSRLSVFAGTVAPIAGDVGIVAGGAGPTLVIKTDRGWAGRAPSGVTMGQFPMIAAWTIPCRR